MAATSKVYGDTHCIFTHNAKNSSEHLGRHYQTYQPENLLKLILKSVLSLLFSGLRLHCAILFLNKVKLFYPHHKLDHRFSSTKNWVQLLLRDFAEHKNVKPLNASGCVILCFVQSFINCCEK